MMQSTQLSLVEDVDDLPERQCFNADFCNRSQRGPTLWIETVTNAFHEANRYLTTNTHDVYTLEQYRHAADHVDIDYIRNEYC